MKNIESIKKGKIIVIDGLDGCGKSTQYNLAAEKLGNAGYKIKPVSFPDYDSAGSAPVKMYLNGEISKNAEDINAYAASSFYAVDRYISYKREWEKDYKSGKIILASRYVTSNLIHQMTKLPENKWDDFADWLYDYEYNKLELPKPDIVIFLDMPIEVNEKLLSKRYNGDETKKDVHEANFEYMRNCRKSALYAAKKDGWNIIECTDGGKLRSIEEINKDILNILKLKLK